MVKSLAQTVGGCSSLPIAVMNPSDSCIKMKIVVADMKSLQLFLSWVKFIYGMKCIPFGYELERRGD